MNSFISPAKNDGKSMSSADKMHLQEITIARAYCWLIAVLHPSWAILMAIFLKDEFNP